MAPRLTAKTVAQKDRLSSAQRSLKLTMPTRQLPMRAALRT